MKTSAIFYMGNKRKICEQLISYFPKNINSFFELFSGSAVISLNTKAKYYYLSDIESHLIDLYQMFREYNSNEIISHIENQIRNFNLPTERTKRTKNIDSELETKREIYKESYFKFRDFYNKNRNVLDFYTLMFFSFSQQFRFNSNNEFNMPFGNDCFSEQNQEYIKSSCKFFHQTNVFFSNMSFIDYKDFNFEKDDFIYCDPPYQGTTAVYNESSKPNSWNDSIDDSFLDFLDYLTKKNIKWGMSNIFHNKTFDNEKLQKWVADNNYNVKHLNMNYVACGKGTGGGYVDEVYIYNYEIKREFLQGELF